MQENKKMAVFSERSVHVLCVCVCVVIEPSSVVDMSSNRRRQRTSTSRTKSQHLQIIPATKSKNFSSSQSLTHFFWNLHRYNVNTVRTLVERRKSDFLIMPQPQRQGRQFQFVLAWTVEDEPFQSPARLCEIAYRHHWLIDSHINNYVDSPKLTILTLHFHNFNLITFYLLY